MKTIITALAIILTGATVDAQTNTADQANAKFISAMEVNLKMLDTTTTATSYIMLANSFDRIGEAGKHHWQPFYYAALCYAYMAINVQDKTKIDPLVTIAETYLQKARLLSQQNSEIFTLQAMLINTSMLTDPVGRFQEYSICSAECIRQAKELDSANPRPYLIEGRTKLFIPAALGGGPGAAKPIVEKAIALYKNFIPENTVAPKWGYSQAEKMLARINGSK